MHKIKVRKQKKEALNISRTRATKVVAQAKYTKAHKEVKRSVRTDKQRYIDNLAEVAEQAAATGNMKQLYDTTRKLTGKYSRQERPVKDKEGQVIMGLEQQLNRWTEHFEELLNRPPDIQAADVDLPIDCSKPTRDEIRRAIFRTKSGKAAGPDDIPAEALKADTETTVEMLFPLFEKIWEEEEDIPADWKEGYLIKIPKKGDLSNCANYRGITLLSVPGKIFNRVILDRMKDAVDHRLRDEQTGFRKERSSTDQITTLRIILEQSTEWNSPLYIHFVDYEKAFDSVHRKNLWQLLRHYGIPIKLTSLIKNSYEGMTCRVAHGGHFTKIFAVRTGVRQGCLLSPFLFLLAIDWILKKTTAGKRNGIQWTLGNQLNDLDFVDDIALLSHNRQQMQEKTSDLSSVSAQLGLRIHEGKTKILKIHATSTEPVKLRGKSLEEVESFTYLGSIIDNQAGTDADVKAKSGKARAAFLMIKKFVELSPAYNTHQNSPLQLQCQVGPSLWSRNLENN